jgi:hypothetical protein
MRYVTALSLCLAISCGGTDDGGGDDVGPATCTVTATALANTSARTIQGQGDVSCDIAATIQLEVCVQWNPSGTFADIMCQSSTMSGVGASAPFTVMNTSSCGLATGRMFRTRVNATIDGTAKPEVLSSMVGCE